MKSQLQMIFPDYDSQCEQQMLHLPTSGTRNSTSSTSSHHHNAFTTPKTQPKKKVQVHDIDIVSPKISKGGRFSFSYPSPLTKNVPVTPRQDHSSRDDMDETDREIFLQVLNRSNPRRSFPYPAPLTICLFEEDNVANVSPQEIYVERSAEDRWYEL